MGVTSGAENEIRRALASQAIQIGDKRYIVALAEWPSDLVYERVSVRFTVSSGDDLYEGEISSSRPFSAPECRSPAIPLVSDSR
jgi:hypothetical protein